MIGIGIATYNEIIQLNKGEEKSDIYEIVVDLIRTIIKFTDDEFLLIIRDNDSLDYRFKKFTVTLKKYFSGINTIFISDPKKSLTDGWNTIIDIAFENDCDSVIICNQDMLVTKFWNSFTKAVQIQSRDIISPLMSQASFRPLQEINEEEFEPVDLFYHVPLIQGCCFGGSRTVFELNKYDRKNFFDPGYEFGYNEIEWQQRNIDKGGRSLLLLNSFVVHIEECSWRGLASTKPTSWTEGKELEYNRFDIKGQIDFKEYLEEKHVV